LLFTFNLYRYASVLPWSSPLAQTIEAPPQGGWQAAFAERFTQQNRPPQLSPTPEPESPPEAEGHDADADAEADEGEAGDGDGDGGEGDDTHVLSHAGRRRLSWSRPSSSRTPSRASPTEVAAAAAAAGMSTSPSTIRREPRTVLVNREGDDAPASVIQTALDACQPGDVVLLTPATYTGSVTLPPGVELRGNGPRGTVLIVSDEEPAVSFDPEASSRRGTGGGGGGDDNALNNAAAVEAAAAAALAGAPGGGGGEAAAAAGPMGTPPPAMAMGALPPHTPGGVGGGAEEQEDDDEELPLPPGLVTNVTLWRQSASSSGTLAGGPPVSCVLVRGGALRLDSCNVVSAGEGVVAEPGARALISACDISAVLSGFVASAGDLCSSVVGGCTCWIYFILTLSLKAPGFKLEGTWFQA
jgi:hypothetical protein